MFSNLFLPLLVCYCLSTFLNSKYKQATLAIPLENQRELLKNVVKVTKYGFPFHLRNNLLTKLIHSISIVVTHPEASLSHRIPGMIPDQSERISMQIRTQATRYQKTKSERIRDCANINFVDWKYPG